MKVLLSLVIFCLSFNVNAQGDKQNKHSIKPSPTIVWESEPQSFLSIKLGLPLSESMQECQKAKYGYDHTYKSLCWEKGYNTSHIVSNTPDFGISKYVVDLSEVDGVVASIKFQIDSRDFGNMADMLNLKYGPPTNKDVSVVQNKMGAKFDNVVMMWVGKTITLTLSGRADRMDRSQVHIYTNKYIESKKFDAVKYKDSL